MPILKVDLTFDHHATIADKLQAAVDNLSAVGEKITGAYVAGSKMIRRVAAAKTKIMALWAELDAEFKLDFPSLVSPHYQPTGAVPDAKPAEVVASGNETA